GETPKGWFITPSGRLGRGLPIPGELETKPISLGDGVILPLANRLHYLPIKSGSRRGDDYTRKLDVNPDKSQPPPKWIHLERLSDNEILAVDSGGALTRIQLRTDPSPHLFESRKLQLPSPVTVPFAAFKDVVVFADANQQLHVMDAQSFQVLGSANLNGNATNAVWMVEGKVFVETNRSELLAFDITPTPKQLWSLPLNGSGLAGSPRVVGGRLVVAKQNGEVLILEPSSNQVLQRHFLGQALVDSPSMLGSHLLVPSLDGSLYPLEALLMGGQ
ncbi:MAG: PQQ-binding-like beta-propeller repeat protein, partial [Planctomycetaceae bacterium]|nr:PQQ-binding-like beta-propeller repeat protein [Planctomycetaceae bacterium]